MRSPCRRRASLGARVLRLAIYAVYTSNDGGGPRAWMELVRGWFSARLDAARIIGKCLKDDRFTCAQPLRQPGAPPKTDGTEMMVARA